MLIKFIALQLLWFGSAAFYCGSDKQQLLRRPLSRSLAVAAFLFGTACSVILFSQLYHWLSASFTVLVVLMFCWCLLTLMAGHCSKAVTALGAGALLMTLLAVLGGANVA
ncbi:hypothetical protein [Rheinheimera gaetbuli]